MDDRLEALERLAHLKASGVLSDAEFNFEKARLLGGTPPTEPQTQSGAKKSHWLVASIVGIAAVLVASGATYLGITKDLTGAQTVEEGEPPESNDAAATDAGPLISAFIKFENAAECVPAAPLKGLLDDMQALQPGEEGRPVKLPENSGTAKVSVHTIVAGPGTGATVAELPVRGSWEGLRVVGLRTVRLKDADIQSFQIKFDEGAEKVRRLLTRQGFDLSKPNDVKTVDLESGGGLVIGIEGTNQTSALVCVSSI